MPNIYDKLRTLSQDITAQDLIEYALIVALLALAAAAGMNGVASAINSAFTNISGKLDTYTS